MKYIEGFANNKGVNIYYIDNGIKNSKKTPLLICPGLSECAKDYIKLINRITDRRCVALSFRGRGISDSPSSGYSLEDHISDIEAVVEELDLKEICVLGISRGVSYELGYCSLNPQKIKGIIITEYPPKHKRALNEWTEESIEIYNRNREFMSINYDVLKSIEKESENISFNTDLKKITCPALILKGNLKDSLLKDEDLSDYINNLGSQNILIKKFDDIGHSIQSENFEKLARAVEEFIITIS